MSFVNFLTSKTASFVDRKYPRTYGRTDGAATTKTTTTTSTTTTTTTKTTTTTLSVYLGDLLGEKCVAKCDYGKSPYGSVVCRRNGMFYIENLGHGNKTNYIGCEYQCER